MAVSEIPKSLILGFTTNNAQTNANGFIRLDAFGITVQNSYPLQAFAASSSYPNGLIAELLMTTGLYWVYIKDNNGAAVKNETVYLYIRYSTV